MTAEGRMLHSDWDRYDTRHAVFQPANMSCETLEAGYWRAYREFYSLRNIWSGAHTKPSLTGAARHFAYAFGWKKLEPLWDFMLRAKQVNKARPILEAVLAGFGRYPSSTREGEAPKQLAVEAQGR
jgi:hypothetical protein